jgi:uncharacterized membrane protein YhaH (DUF805 family)
MAVCRECEYDLSGLEAAGARPVCPECGSAVPRADEPELSVELLWTKLGRWGWVLAALPGLLLFAGVVLSMTAPRFRDLGVLWTTFLPAGVVWVGTWIGIARWGRKQGLSRDERQRLAAFVAARGLAVGVAAFMLVLIIMDVVGRG